MVLVRVNQSNGVVRMRPRNSEGMYRLVGDECDGTMCAPFPFVAHQRVRVDGCLEIRGVVNL